MGTGGGYKNSNNINQNAGKNKSKDGKRTCRLKAKSTARTTNKFPMGKEKAE